MGPVCFFRIWLKVKYPALGKKKTLDGRHQLLIREKRSDPTLTTLSSRTEALLVKIVFTENRLFKDKFLEKVGGANAPLPLLLRRL